MEKKSRLESSRYLLTADNYSIWLVSIEAKLDDIGACEVITGIVKLKEDSTPDQITAYSLLSRKGYSKIVQNLDPTNLALVSTMLPETDRFNGRALWKLLKEKYAGSDLVARSAALDQFLDLEYKDVVSFCSAIHLANQRLLLAGVLKDNQVKMMIMLRKLPKNQFQSFRDIIAMGFATKTFEDSIKRLESFTISNNIKKETSASTSEQATMMTTTKTGAACHHCGKTGHRPHNCWVKFPEKAPKTKSAHFTVINEYNQLQGVTNWCMLPNGTWINADDISYDCLCGILSGARTAVFDRWSDRHCPTKARANWLDRFVQPVPAGPVRPVPGTDRTGLSNPAAGALVGQCLSDHRSNTAVQAPLELPCLTG
ncbi:hypothetical protein PCANC_02871 [Puccinia coronata f. sp. avenae]|uniref:CCHC-type domain-containing protein n=1 Tax=Puccinia coronata f. sp. avenae TaxID=200324 RepID=A0A2N5T8B7_9BASI|nr:hypothetical protein PCANC_02871 [Puccinia coronata f. sp. avenae]